MTQDEAATHWQERARSELKAARILFEKKEPDVYGEVLFHCHLALELALKARYILKKDEAAPFTHDLNELADLLESNRKQHERDDFEEITDFAILSRYGDDQWFSSNATAANAGKWLQKTERILSSLFV
ncbi:HEPN domain-containing protein [Candidatus Peregrinibacteria bacterium]|nr:HEPN domain-containing protein [Candidatus Peregrinibacteria bacterium]